MPPRQVDGSADPRRGSPLHRLTSASFAAHQAQPLHASHSAAACLPIDGIRSTVSPDGCEGRLRGTQAWCPQPALTAALMQCAGSHTVAS